MPIRYFYFFITENRVFDLDKIFDKNHGWQADNRSHVRFGIYGENFYHSDPERRLIIRKRIPIWQLIATELVLVPVVPSRIL